MNQDESNIFSSEILLAARSFIAVISVTSSCAAAAMTTFTPPNIKDARQKLAQAGQWQLPLVETITTERVAPPFKPVPCANGRQAASFIKPGRG
jgi:hypothetical protein